MSDTHRPAPSGWPIILAGAILTLLGTGLSDTSPPIGYAVLTIGAALAAVGVIAAGVTIGIARAYQLRQHRD